MKRVFSSREQFLSSKPSVVDNSLSNATVGSAMMDGLSNFLGLGDDGEKAPPQIITSVEVENARNFDHSVDSFKFTTHMLRLINDVVSSLVSSNQTAANFRFDSKGITITSFLHANTVCYLAFLGKDLFSQYSCNKEVHTSLFLKKFAENFSLLRNLNVETITFENNGDDLVLRGQRKNKPDQEVELKSLLEDGCNPLEIAGSFTYEVPFRLLSKEFIAVVQGMPPSFTIQVECSKKQLIFRGTEDHSTATLALSLDTKVIETIKGHPEVQNFRADFMKSNLAQVLKMAKLSEHVTLGLASNCPLFVRVNFNEGECPSTVDIYVSSKVDESELDEDE